ncbi:peptide deformylase [Candidatus Nomurabacteria bacterium]|jgi:peptide deformylase|nr:peptide deformylase [Candidatus Saccharibacteria bacterium]MCA9350972.1 peptide deformylase [Candidatus Saccharibacteria bacterium]MCB9839515.1 peptide deformylase [Candidatus Nomurabacteria bacterium]
MSYKDKIISLPNPSLRQRSTKVGFVAEDTKKLIENMKLATLDWEDSRNHELGVALAAVQIDVLKRVVIIREDFEDKKNRNFVVFINPEITKLEGDIVEDYEGCLSIKDIYGKVPRYNKVRVKAIDENGHEFRVKAEGFLARIFQHEVDHTNGTVFIDHIKDDPDAFFKLAEDGQLEKLNYDKEIANNKSLFQD